MLRRHNSGARRRNTAWRVASKTVKLGGNIVNIRHIDHFVITTANLEACLAFYVGLLGMEHHSENGRHALLFGRQKINIHTKPGELQPDAANPGPGTQDFCLIVDEDLTLIKRELEARGQSILAGIVRRQGAQGPIQSLYLRDPDGNLVELAGYLPPLQDLCRQSEYEEGQGS